MAINNYELANKPYTRGLGDAMVTIVEIRLQDGNRYSADMRELPGDRTGESENVLIQAVFDILKAELDPSSAIVKTQQELVEVKKAQELSKVTDKMIHVLVLNSVMSKNIGYGTTYKELVELIPLAEVGKTYLPHDLITIEDPNHVEVNGEGKRILVQLNKEFTYNGEPVSDFATNGTLEQNGTGVAWKFEGKE